MAKTLHLVSILDRSGSMWNTEKEVIGAYNSFIEQQRKIAEENNIKIKASLILFDDQYEKVYEKVSLNDVPELTEDVYYTRGMTALYDAVGKTINAFKKKKNVIMFIETDGMENSSKEYNSDSVKQLVDEKTKAGWDFNFVGADLDNMTTGNLASSLGISKSKSMSIDKSLEGYTQRNTAFASATTAYVDKMNN